MPPPWGAATKSASSHLLGEGGGARTLGLASPFACVLPRIRLCWQPWGLQADNLERNLAFYLPPPVLGSAAAMVAAVHLAGWRGPSALCGGAGLRVQALVWSCPCSSDGSRLSVQLGGAWSLDAGAVALDGGRTGGSPASPVATVLVTFLWSQGRQERWHMELLARSGGVPFLAQTQTWRLCC